MKKINVSAVFLVVFVCQVLCQEISVPEPEFTGIVLSVKAEQLEKQKAASASKADIGAALFGVSKAKGLNMVSGVQSPVRVFGGEKLAFIVKVKENDRDPVEVVNFFRLEKDIKKERRTIVTGTVNFNQSQTSKTIVN